MKADIYLIDQDTQKEYFVGNHEIRTPEEKKQQHDNLMTFLRSINADIEYMQVNGYLSKED